MSHLKHPGTHWGRQLVDAGQARYMHVLRREERRRSRHTYNQFYRELSEFGSASDFDEDGEMLFVFENFDEPCEHHQEYLDQADYLAPLEHFLASNVNRPWAEIHSKLSRRLNLNSMTGDHVRSHLVGYIENQPWRIEQEKDSATRSGSRYKTYYVDDDGMFRILGKEPELQTKGKNNRNYRRFQKLAERLLAKSPHHVETTKDRKNILWTPDPLVRTTYDSESAARAVRSSSGKFSFFRSENYYKYVYSEARIVLHGRSAHWGIPVQAKYNPTYNRTNWVYRPGPRLSKKDADVFWSLSEDVRAECVHS